MSRYVPPGSPESDAWSPEHQPGEIVTLRHHQGRTESAVARWISARHQHHVRFVSGQKKFIVYDGKRWEHDNGSVVDALIRRDAEEQFTELDALSDEISTREATEALRFVKSTLSGRGVAAIKKLMPSDSGMTISADTLDQDPFLFNVNNGTIDTRTGELLKHDPAMMLTKFTPIDYDPAAICPTWLRFIGEIFENDELRDLAQRLCGYFLTGSVREHKLFLFWGAGANGKSVFTETIATVLGEYAMPGAPDLLMQKGDAHPTELAALFGRRFVPCMETEEGRRLAEARVKMLTGGDSISARRMKEDFWSFKPTHKLVLCTNHKPELRGTDNGIRRRLYLIPFQRTFAPDQQDRGLPAKLRQELPGILAWMVQGAKRWATEGLGEPECVTAATTSYIDSQDVIGSFIAERCIVATWAKVRASSLYGNYQHWCESSGEHFVSQRRFGQSIDERGFGKRVSNGTWYDGIGLRDLEATEPLD